MNTEIKNVISARQTVRCMGMGFMPSEERGHKAIAALRKYIDSGNATINPLMAFDVIDDISRGLLASQHKCNSAGQELAHVIQDMKDSFLDSQKKIYRERQ